jgi:hypothetical protein
MATCMVALMFTKTNLAFILIERIVQCIKKEYLYNPDKLGYVLESVSTRKEE